MRFQGGATKYLNSYLYWFFMLDKHKRIDVEQQNERLLHASNRTPTPVRVQQFRLRLGGCAC